MSERLCPNCRKALSENVRFCIECGSRIDFQSTRKELDGYEEQEEGGLKVGIRGTNPFYSKSDKLKEKILNSELKPFPEKKKKVLREGESLGSERIDNHLDVDSEQNETESEKTEVPEKEENIPEMAIQEREESIDEAEILEEEEECIVEPPFEKFQENYLEPKLETIHEIGEKLINNIEEESGDTVTEIKENRIITTPISGGFKKRLPQAEEVKDIGTFLKKGLKGDN